MGRWRSVISVPPTIPSAMAREKGTLGGVPAALQRLFAGAHLFPRAAQWLTWLCNGIFRKGLKMDLVLVYSPREGCHEMPFTCDGGSPRTHLDARSVAYKG